MSGKNSELKLLPVATLVGWLTCALVGALGLSLPYPAVRETRKTEEAVIEAVKIEPIKEPEVVKLNTPQAGTPSAEVGPISEAPPLPPTIVPTQAPPAMTLVVPSAAVSFAVPVEGPTRTVEIRQADHQQTIQTGTETTSSNGNSPGSVTPPVTAQTITKLTYGEGEGRQASPDYPRESVIGRQEGTVLIRFTVNENGRVIQAQVETGCRWPRLNQEALRTVREKWRFGPGPQRLYEVAIEFQLAK